jgi:hypothetical protein
VTCIAVRASGLFILVQIKSKSNEKNKKVLPFFGAFYPISWGILQFLT